MKYSDGSSRKPRAEQIDYFNHFDKVRGSYKYFVLNAAPGLGKSYIARAITNIIGNAAIITPSNQLVDQYCETYPELVPIKGQEWYNSEDEFRLAKKQVREGAPAIFNPISFYYHYVTTPDLRPNFVVIDEAHNLASMLVSIISQPFKCDYWGIPDDLDDEGFMAWLDKRTAKLGQVQQVPKFAEQYQRLVLLKQYLEKNLTKVKFSYEMRPNFRTKTKEKYFCITPLTFPKDLLDIVFGEDTKILFMSGTFNKLHAKELGLKEYDFKEYDHPAPRENRIVHAINVNRTEVRLQAHHIKGFYQSNKCCPTLVHIPYSLQKEFKKYLPTAITHTKETKQAAVEKFKRKGGILLASGMAEGIDLPDDFCRLIIIPKLLYPNLGDDGVKKRKLMPDGQTWYNNQTITTTIQQIYRGVRGKEDWCHIVILDPLLKRLVQSTEKYLSTDFVKSIKWSK